MSAYEQLMRRKAAWAELTASLDAQAVKPEWYFKGMSEAAAQNWVGERIYPFAHAKYPRHAGKITGMILEEFTVPEVYALLGDEQKRNATIEEAEGVLQKFEAEQAAAKAAEAAALTAKFLGGGPICGADITKIDLSAVASALMPKHDVTANKGDAQNASAISAAMAKKKRGGRR